MRRASARARTSSCDRPLHRCTRQTHTPAPMQSSPRRALIAFSPLWPELGLDSRRTAHVDKQARRVCSSFCLPTLVHRVVLCCVVPLECPLWTAWHFVFRFRFMFESSHEHLNLMILSNVPVPDLDGHQPGTAATHKRVRESKEHTHTRACRRPRQNRYHCELKAQESL